MPNLDKNSITCAVIERFADTPDPRLREILTSHVQHLHAFAPDVKLTEHEWFQGIDFLTRTGNITDEKRQEFILLSDVLGLSMLTVTMNNEKPTGCTEATVFGPFLRHELIGLNPLRKSIRVHNSFSQRSKSLCLLAALRAVKVHIDVGEPVEHNGDDGT